MEWLILICYLIASYGACNIIVFGEGPFSIFSKIRELAMSISPSLGKLFSCMMCLPANWGWIISLFNWFLIPMVAFTPFNIIFAGTNLWWLAALLDGAITSGFCWILYVIDEYFEKNTPYEEISQDNDDTVINVDDIKRLND